MAETAAPGAAKDSAKEGDSSSEGGRIWRGLKALLFGTEEGRAFARSLRTSSSNMTARTRRKPIEGDLVPVERQMLKNMLHFSQHTADDVAVRARGHHRHLPGRHASPN